ncbi:MAG: ABC transporter permease [Firmicutes bacterium]|nr:ABC transporter permease [[Eubacterium] siraeum]MCM1486752.1 ABC transporter permease [Bacillota bacterium]
MKDFLKLTQNELIKVCRQISWRILTVIALVIAAALPLLGYGISLLGTGHTDYRELADRVTDSLQKAYYLTRADADDFFNERNMGEDSWQYSYYYYDYVDVCCSIKALELMIADDEFRTVPDINEVFYIDGLERVWEGDRETDKYTYRERIVNSLTGEVTYGDEQDFTPELARRLKRQLESEKIGLEKKIGIKFSVYINDKFAEYKKQYQQAQNELNTVEAIYQNNKSVINRYQIAKLKAEGLKIILQTQQQMTYLDSVSLKRQNNIIDTLNTMANTVLNYSSDYAAISPEDFEAQGVYYYRGCEFRDYGKYTAAVQKQQDTYYQGLRQYGYALSNNIPIASLDYSSTRKNLSDALAANTEVIMFLAIFLSAVIVANEHTSGAIRLLMIRPRSRWKILLSKLFCVVLYTVGLTVLTSLLTTLTEAAIYGGGDLNVPYIMVSGDSITELPPILYYIYWNLIHALPSVFSACTAFLLSVLAKRGVLALAVSMLINVFGSLVSQISYDLIIKAEWLKFTPAPYFNITDAFPEPMILTRSWNNPQIYGLSLGAGTAVLLIYSLVLLITAFVIFDREQIKN